MSLVVLWGSPHCLMSEKSFMFALVAILQENCKIAERARCHSASPFAPFSKWSRWTNVKILTSSCGKVTDEGDSSLYLWVSVFPSRKIKKRLKCQSSASSPHNPYFSLVAAWSQNIWSSFKAPHVIWQLWWTVMTIQIPQRDSKLSDLCRPNQWSRRPLELERPHYKLKNFWSLQYYRLLHLSAGHCLLDRGDFSKVNMTKKGNLTDLQFFSQYMYFRLFVMFSLLYALDFPPGIKIILILIYV